MSFVDGFSKMFADNKTTTKTKKFIHKRNNNVRVLLPYLMK